jgi:hypothetical protein
MSELSHEEDFPAWEQSSSFRRAQLCITMLNIYGILPDHQAAQARNRLITWKEKHPIKASGASTG